MSGPLFQPVSARRAAIRRETTVFARRFDQTALMQRLCRLFKQAALDVTPHHRDEFYG